MARAILIMGESGSGKTTAMRTLNPAETFYIDADGKGLSWKGWRQQYNAEAKNYLKSSDMELIQKAMAKINEKPTVKYLVIDTLNGAMLESEMSNIQDKGYSKWVDLADNVYRIVRMISTMRDDLTVICIGHAETITDDNGYKLTRLKTNGRKLEKIVLESKFTTVLLAKGNEGKYVFETKAIGSTAKTPLGMFDQAEIPNDIQLVLKAQEEY